jgi:hypothetical protein
VGEASEKRGEVSVLKENLGEMACSTYWTHGAWESRSKRDCLEQCAHQPAGNGARDSRRRRLHGGEEAGGWRRASQRWQQQVLEAGGVRVGEDVVVQ